MGATTFQVTQGTQTQLANDLVGTTVYAISKIDIGPPGATVPFTGTFLGGTLNAGTTSINGGTLNAGTFTVGGGTLVSGTVDSVSQLPLNSWGTTISTAGSTLGTIKPLVSGSQIFITDIIISAGTATTLVIGNGGTSTPLIGTLSFAQNGGMVCNFRTPISTTVGSALVYQQSVANTLTITASGFVR